MIDPKFKITRTYPLPDDQAAHIAPRYRAMAVFKYLLDMEPEDAVKDERFAVVQRGFEVAEERGATKVAFGEFTEGRH